MLLPILPLTIFILLSSHQFSPLSAEPPPSSRSALLAFLSAVPHSPRLSWPSANSSIPTCSWLGVTCDASSSSIIALRLPALSLVGPVPPSTISLLSSLRVLSLHSNSLSGPLPDLSNLTLLRSLYLHNNSFSGPIPPQIGDLFRLYRLDLSNNNLSGAIPFSISNLSRLTGLFLQRNQLSGSIPSINIQSLQQLDLSYNKLNGSIPATLSRFPSSSFAGNLALCGFPLSSPCSPFFPSPASSPESNISIENKRRHHRLSTGIIIAIAVAATIAFLLLIISLLLCCAFLKKRRSQQGKDKTTERKAPTATAREVGRGTEATSSTAGMTSLAGEGERNKLVFVGKEGGGGGYSFDLEDLLRASAEVLGKGSVGTSYKAVLEDGTTVVVKRLKDVTASKREFESVMDGIGKLDHSNLLGLRAYYYSKDEKLLVVDYLPSGSLSALLHGSRGSGRTPLDWDSRMRIALAAGRGLVYLHTSANVVHGDIKASNVLLRSDLDASVLSDYGLHTLFGFGTAQHNRVAGYRAPEIVDTRRPTFKSDVYSYGVLLLELLTGKAPNQASLGEDGIDLPRWVQSVVREEWTAEVFDVELMRFNNIEEEMVQLLQIAMACVQTVPDSRPEITEVVRMVEEIVNRGESTDEGVRVSSEEQSKGGSGTAVTPAQATSTP